MTIMKKLIVILVSALLALCSVSAFAAVPNGDAYITVVDWSTITEDQLNGGGAVGAFADLSYWDTSSNGQQYLKDGQFVIKTLEGDNNCYQFSMGAAFEDEEKEAWVQSDYLRFYLDNRSGCEFFMTMYLYTQELGTGYGSAQPMTNSLGVYLIYENEPGEIYEPDFCANDSFANRYYYIPDDFKGWVVVPSTICSEEGDDLTGWIHSYWAPTTDIDYSNASMENALGIAFDIRAQDVDFEKEIAFGSFELVGEGDLFTTPDPSDVLAPEDETPAPSEDAATDAPDGTAEPSDDPAPANNNIGLIIGIAVAAVVVIAAVVLLIIIKKSKKVE